MTGRSKLFVSITLVSLALFWSVGLATRSSGDWPFAAETSITAVDNLSGPFGSLLAWLVYRGLGAIFCWVIPAVLFAYGLFAFHSVRPRINRLAVKVLVLTVLLNAMFALTPYADTSLALRGSIGDGIASVLSTVAGQIGSTIVVIASILLVLSTELGRLRGLVRVPSFAGFSRVGARATHWLGDARDRVAEMFAREEHYDDDESPAEADSREPDLYGVEDTIEEVEDIEVVAPPAGVAVTGAFDARPVRPKSKSKPKPKQSDGPKKPLSQATLPSLELLDRDNGESGETYSAEALKSWSTVLEDKLANYGVEGKVTSVHHGPVVTTFEFEPAAGVRIQQITSRADDLALAMRARSLRMIAPIPGRAAVGIEIPNPKSRVVYLYDVLTQINEQQRYSGVMLGLSVDVVGKPFAMNLCDAPHLLIAGTTGSGKSVCLNAILASILFQYRPEDVQLILVDPKMVEMSLYNGIPHLMHPVITDPKEAAKAMEYLVAEMGRRNKLFQKHAVRNIASYNAKLAMGKIEVEEGEDPPEKLPYIVLMVDELGDLALAKGTDIGTLLTRLAQMARAAGIHMVLATQRPSVDVLIGKTKANFPTRIAFRVATKVDSRTILDTIGADKLLGKGDMLFMDAMNPSPLRLHGAWVAEKELESLIDHWKGYEFDEASLNFHANRVGGADPDDDLDPLFEDAVGVVVQFKQGSTSLLQRRLHIGYARAARVLDQLEQNGIVGPPDGSKPREVYLDAVERIEDR